MKVFSPFLNGNTTTSGSFNVPNHPSTASIQNPLTGSLFHDDTDGILKVYTGTQWAVVGEQTEPASGPASANIEYLVVAGGGGGGSYGGGGAGGYLSSSLASVTSGSTFTVTVGSGGAGSGNNYDDPGQQGVNSSVAGASITTITALGGGYGGDNNEYPAADGGSGGGGSDGPTDASGGSGTVGQGNDGGAGSFSDPHYMGGGGGGASAAGTAGVATGTRVSGTGGDGLASKITGQARFRAGGGGGVRFNTTGTIGAGGAGGGGNGGTWNGSTSTISSATAGTANSGSGGGPGQNGGSGVAIFAYNSGSINGAGGIVGDAGNGRKYNQLNSSDTFKVGATTDFQIITDSLEVHLDAGHFSSRGTSTWTDLTGNGYNATAVNSPTLNNYDYTFNGTTQEFSINISGITWGSAATLEAWVKFDVATPPNGAQTGIWTFDGSGNASISHYPYSNGYGYFSTFRNTRVGPITLDSSVTLTDWHHVVITSTSGGNWIFYQNTSVTHTTPADQSTINTGVTNYIGRSISGTGVAQDRRIDGNIGQFRLYSKALSATEVLQNYEATKTNFV